MVEKAKICGIDLGTTNSLVAYLDAQGTPRAIPTFTGSNLTPSMVFLEGDSAVVGSQAFRLGSDQPDRFAECFKRYMGADTFPMKVEGVEVRPEVLSALVLRRLRAEAKRQLGAADRAVITVPAYFDECRRRATKNAGEIAGWDVVDLINEPTAAAIAYAHQSGELGISQSARERVLIYDLGGGTFDTTILEIVRGLEYRAIATEGEVQLGGQDWDEWLADHLAEQFKSKTGLDPRDKPQGVLEFLGLARKAKHTLSSRKTASLPARFLGKNAVLDVTLDAFEQGTSHLLHRSRQTTEMVLEQAKLAWKDLDRVLLTGGSTRMPMVAKMLEKLTGRPPSQVLSPDEAVAHGAAIHGTLLGKPGSPRVINVNSHSYRIGCVNKQGKQIAHPLIPKNSQLPKESTVVLPLPRAGLEQFHVKVLEGESDDTNLCFPVGTIHVTGLPKDPEKRWLVRIALRCVQDGKIAARASVLDPENRSHVVREAGAVLEPQYGMTPEQVATAKRFVDGLKLNE